MKLLCMQNIIIYKFDEENFFKMFCSRVTANFTLLDSMKLIVRVGYVYKQGYNFKIYPFKDANLMFTKFAYIYITKKPSILHPFGKYA